MKKLLTLAVLATLAAGPTSAATVHGAPADSTSNRVLQAMRDGFTVREASGSRVALVLGRNAVSSHPAAPAAWTMKIAARW